MDKFGQDHWVRLDADNFAKAHWPRKPWQDPLTAKDVLAALDNADKVIRIHRNRKLVSRRYAELYAESEAIFEPGCSRETIEDLFSRICALILSMRPGRGLEWRGPLPRKGSKKK